MTKSWNDLADLENTPESTSNNLLIIDSNNLSYRFIRRSNYNSYEGEFVRTVTSLGKSYNAKDTICCFDFGKSYYRMDMFDAYKGNREEPTDEEELKKKQEFFEVLNKLPEILPVDVIKHRGVEADDTIAFLVTNLKKHYEHIWVVSSDKDLIQLIDDNVSIFNIFSRKEITKESLQETTGLTPAEFMLARIIEGDKGDNILGIEGIGVKRSQSLAKEYKTLSNLISALPIKGKAKYIQNLNAGVDQLLRNEQLINLIAYNEKALSAGKEKDEVLMDLYNYVNKYS